MKTIKMARESCLVDDDDFERLSQFAWCLVNGYASNVIRGNHMYMHHAVIGKPPSGMETHHKDGNKLNNQKHNLEFVTHDTNQHHAKRHNRLGYRGLKLNKAKFNVQIRKAGITYCLGTYEDAEEAARVYDKKALELFGPCATLNFPLCKQ